MAFPPEDLKIWVNSREYSCIIQAATYPPFTKGTNGDVLPLLHAPHHTTPCTCNYCPLLPFCARKRVYLRSYYKFSSDARRVIYARERVYLLVS